MSFDLGEGPLKITILGCGSSGGVPRFGGEDGSGRWGACDPTDPRNRRSRCALLVEQEGPEGVTRALIDTGPDIRQQLLDARTPAVDGVLYTHDHADHLHGIDDLRLVVHHRRQLLDVWADAKTMDTIENRFGYVFKTPEGSAYPPILIPHLITEDHLAWNAPVRIEGAGGAIEAWPFYAQHGRLPALGFRIGAMAYLPDANAIFEETWPKLDGLDLWIVDALRIEPHPSHAHLALTLEWIEKARPSRAVLTNLNVELDYRETEAACPPRVIPAVDGMVVRSK